MKIDIAMEFPALMSALQRTLWELRNQRFVANVLDAAASTEPGRVPVLIG